MCKKVIPIILALVMVFSVFCIPAVNAQGNVIIMKLGDPNMTVDGAVVEIDPGRGTAPMIYNDRTVIPIRSLVESLGGNVAWDAGEQKITLTANGHTVEMWVDKTNIVVDGESKTVDVAPVIINERTMVPVRFAAENLGFDVGWNDATKEITVSSASNKPAISDITGLRAYILTLPVDEPTNGRDISVEELESILAPYYAKFNYGNGNTFYYYTTRGDFAKKGEKWEMSDDVTVSQMWSRVSGENYRLLSETLTIFNAWNEEKVGVTECMLMKDDDSFSYTYSWVKGAKEGEMMKFPKRPGTGTEGYDGGEYIPDNRGRARIYDDKMVDGKLCKVYSYGDGEDRTYYFVSTVNGVEIMNASYDPEDGVKKQNMHFVLDMKSINTEESLFNLPSGVNFVDIMDSFDFNFNFAF